MLRSVTSGLPRGGEATSFDVTDCGETYKVTLKRTAAARRFTLRVRSPSGEVVLTIPARANLCEAKSFAARHASWIGAKIRRLPRRTSFRAGEQVPLRGVMHEIASRRVARGNVWVETPAGSGPDARLPILCVNAEPCFVPRRVRDFLVTEARRDLEAAVARYAAAFQVSPSKLTLRDTRSRWGSCSSAGALSFSWRLVMAPSYVLDYLAAHEVAHLLHMNHSAAFWEKVAESCPASAHAETWLQANGASLHRFALDGCATEISLEPETEAQLAGAAVAATSSRRLR
jgi:predicted metal-dependent hydrolase